LADEPAEWTAAGRLGARGEFEPRGFVDVLAADGFDGFGGTVAELHAASS